MHVFVFDKKGGTNIGPHTYTTGMSWVEEWIKEQEALGRHVEVHRNPGKTGKPGRIVYETPASSKQT